MQYRVKSGQNLTEPVTVTELKTYIGYTETDQDSYFGDLITAVRLLVEQHTSLSCIAKIYQVLFERYDWERGWMTLPIAPVDEITSVQVNSEDVEYEVKGLTEQSIYVQTIGDNGISVEYSVEASEHLAIMKTVILMVCAAAFTNKTGYGEFASVSPILTPDALKMLRNIKIPSI